MKTVKVLCVFLLAAILSVGCNSSQTVESESQTVFLSDHVILYRHFFAGKGVVVDYKGQRWMLTARHVVDKDRPFSQWFDDWQGIDLVAFKVSDTIGNELGILRMGQVVTWGSKGKSARVVRFRSHYALLNGDQPIHGESGSSLRDEDGRVVGIVIGYTRDEDRFGVAVTGQAIKRLLDTQMP